MTRALDGVQACVFDAYGTLFDFASAAARCPDIPEESRAALTTLWRDKQLQYAWLRTLENRYADFWQVTGEALDFALEATGRPDPALRPRQNKPSCSRNSAADARPSVRIGSFTSSRSISSRLTEF